MDNSKLIKLAIALLVPLIIALIPSGSFPLDITIVEQRIVAIFIFAAMMWILEPIPIWTTSVSVIVLMLLTTSKSMVKFLDYSETEAEEFGTAIAYKDIMATFADPVIMLFMGGFVLAIIASKYKLDAGIAKLILTPFGNKSEMVLLGFIVVTAVCSMFMSNTALIPTNGASPIRPLCAPQR